MPPSQQQALSQKKARPINNRWQHSLIATAVHHSGYHPGMTLIRSYGQANRQLALSIAIFIPPEKNTVVQRKNRIIDNAISAGCKSNYRTVSRLPCAISLNNEDKDHRKYFSMIRIAYNILYCKNN